MAASHPPAAPAVGCGQGRRSAEWTLGKGGLTGSLKNLKSFFGFGDDKLVNLGGGRGASGGWIGQYGSFGDKLQALGKSDAAMMGGAMLAFNGLQRGGWTGMGEDVAGGAMIGYKFGGPLGAAIGASIGLEAGIVRMFIKGPVEKTKEKVKALYGVDIRDKGVLNQIVQMAKSGFGGNLDMAIRSPQIRDLIQLYAMTTGQKISGMPGAVTPLSLVEKGGSLYQSPQYNNGTALSALGGLPSLSSIGSDLEFQRKRDGRNPASDRLDVDRQRGDPGWPRGGARRDHGHEEQRWPAGVDRAPVESGDVGELNAWLRRKTPRPPRCCRSRCAARSRTSGHTR